MPPRGSWRAIVATLVGFYSSFTAACDVCDGVAAKKVASGEVLEISDEGLERLAPAHPLLALLLYKPYDPRTQPMQSAFDAVAAALKSEGLLDRCVMAQINAESFPRASARLHIEAVELPAIRVLRGDASFGYPLLTGLGSSAQELAAHIKQQLDRGAAPLVATLSPADIGDLEHRANDTRVIAEVSNPMSSHALEQVAHALHGAVRFATPLAPPPGSAPTTPTQTAAAAPTPPSSPPSIPAPSEASKSPTSPPQAGSAARGAAAASTHTASIERVRLLRENSADMVDDPPTIEMPHHFAAVAGEPPSARAEGGGQGAGAAISARALYRWVRWAALPSVFALTPATSSSYLAEGASGVLFLPGLSQSNQTRQYAVRRLRKLASRLNTEEAHGLWLLWAYARDPAHVRLRAQLGLADATATASAAAATPAGSVEGGEFAIVVMAGGRILHRFVMPPPFGFDNLYAFARAFLDGELVAAERRRHNLFMLGGAAALLVLIVGGWPVWRWLWRWCCGGAPVRLASRPAAGAARKAKGTTTKAKGASGEARAREAQDPPLKSDSPSGSTKPKEE